MPSTFVDLIHSPTGASIKQPWPNDAVAVVCSNSWKEEVSQLEQASDGNSVQGNCVGVRVTDPLWVED